MPEHLGPLGHDPDWYDKGPGSEAFKREVACGKKEYADELHEQRLRESRIVKAAEARFGGGCVLVRADVHVPDDCDNCGDREICKLVRGEEPAT